MCVSAGEKEGIEAPLTLVARNRIGNKRRVDVPEVRPGVDVVDRGCNVELLHLCEYIIRACGHGTGSDKPCPYNLLDNAAHRDNLVGAGLVSLPARRRLATVILRYEILVPGARLLEFVALIPLRLLSSIGHL